MHASASPSAAAAVPEPVLRRGRGRPSKPKGMVRSVNLTADLDDAVCRLAVVHGVSVHAVLLMAVRRMVARE